MTNQAGFLLALTKGYFRAVSADGDIVQFCQF
jgi:hypothetical protein